MYLEPDFPDAFFLGGEEAGNGLMQRPCFGPEDSVIGGERAMGVCGDLPFGWDDALLIYQRQFQSFTSAQIGAMFRCPGGATAGPSEPGGVDDPTAEL